MKQILLFGAGKSATVLIDYLLSHAATTGWELTVADADLELALSKINNSPYGHARSFDILDGEKRGNFIHQADLIISMLPPSLHTIVARDCLAFSKHLLTASYVDDEMRSMQAAISEKKLLFLCEMGLDPGIDHMSAMKLIDEIKTGGGQITSFQSHCGGLVAPESDDNPWHYKISWNPRNIIMAGKAGAHFRENNQEVRLSHKELFATGRSVTIPGIGPLSWYPNRDSLSYEPLYGLQQVPDFIRTTLRHPDFMKGWQHIIGLGLTEESPVYDTRNRSLYQAFREHIAANNTDSRLVQKLRQHFGLPVNIPNGELPAMSERETKESNLVWEQLLYLGIDDRQTMINKDHCSPADLLQFAVEQKLRLLPEDKDMIVMLHEFEYETGAAKSLTRSCLVVKGEDSLRTAMAKTVGLPLGITAKLVLNGTLQLRGLHIPTHREIYEPVLKELEEYDIKFVEEKRRLI